MIGYLSGKVLSAEDNMLLLETGGVGYEIFVGGVGPSFRDKVGGAVSVWIYTYVREDQITLFGFKEALLKKIFTILIGINGVGPKLAMAVVCQLSPSEFVDAVTMGNTKLLRSISGIGPKMADRMVLELKDKLAAFVKTFEWAGQDVGQTSVWRDLGEALTGLGFSDQKIRNVITLLRKENGGADLQINQLLKQALQKIKNC